jgi:hypothetical protein
MRTAKPLFAVRPKICARERLERTAIIDFPVVFLRSYRRVQYEFFIRGAWKVEEQTTSNSDKFTEREVLLHFSHPRVFYTYELY